MNEPRLIAKGDDLRAELLRSAKRDLVPAGAKERAIRSAVAHAATLPKSSPLTTTLKAWLPKLFGLVLLGAGGAGLASFAAAPEPRAAVTRPRAPHAPLVEAPPEAISTASTTTPPASAPTMKAAAVPTTGTPKSRLAEEVRRLERVRVALVEGDSERALRELAAYEREFPSAQLAQDATRLKIEALERSGQGNRIGDPARPRSGGETPPSAEPR